MKIAVIGCGFVGATVANYLEKHLVEVHRVDPKYYDTTVFDIRETCANEYAHSRAYLRRLAEQDGLSVISITVMEHRAYPGLWCVFQL